MENTTRMTTEVKNTNDGKKLYLLRLPLYEKMNLKTEYTIENINDAECLFLAQSDLNVHIKLKIEY